LVVIDNSIPWIGEDKLEELPSKQRSLLSLKYLDRVSVLMRLGSSDNETVYGDRFINRSNDSKEDIWEESVTNAAIRKYLELTASEGVMEKEAMAVACW
jgi:hypothetical protein